MVRSELCQVNLCRHLGYCPLPPLTPSLGGGAKLSAWRCLLRWYTELLVYSTALAVICCEFNAPDSANIAIWTSIVGCGFIMAYINAFDGNANWSEQANHTVSLSISDGRDGWDLDDRVGEGFSTLFGGFEVVVPCREAYHQSQINKLTGKWTFDFICKLLCL